MKSPCLPGICFSMFTTSISIRRSNLEMSVCRIDNCCHLLRRHRLFNPFALAQELSSSLAIIAFSSELVRMDFSLVALGVHDEAVYKLVSQHLDRPCLLCRSTAQFATNWMPNAEYGTVACISSITLVTTFFDSRLEERRSKSKNGS